VSKSTLPLLIGMGGLKTSGKDAASDFLVQHRGFVKIGMSAGLHECLMALNPWVRVTPTDVQNLAAAGIRVPADMLDIHTIWRRYADLERALGYTDMKIIAEVRSLQQRMGTEVGRDLIDQNIWTDMTARTVQRLREDGHPVVVTGIRYSNELKMIRRLDGRSIWVDRPSVRLAQGQHPTLDTHSSETSLDHHSFDRLLSNDGTLDCLRERVLDLVEDMGLTA